MSDIQRDREERQHVIEVLKSWDGYFIGYTSDEAQEALRYAIASIETDLRYDLLYEETSGQADKPTTKNNLGVDKTFYEQIVEYCNEHFLVLVEKDVWEDARKALTTKNDLGVDAISRQKAIDTIRQLYLDLASQKAVIDIIKALPSVTPQEPRKITLEDVKGYCEPRSLTIISNELLYELTHPKIKALEQESASTQEYGLTDADTDKYAVQVQNGEGYYNSFGRYVSYDLD